MRPPLRRVLLLLCAPAAAAQWTKHAGKNCYTGHGATDLESPTGAQAGRFTVAQCERLCDGSDGCGGVTVSVDGGAAVVDCARRAGIDIGECEDDGGWDTWVRSGGPAPAPAPAAQWTKHAGKNCYTNHGATDLESPTGAQAGRFTVAQCERLCDGSDGCQGVTVSVDGGAAVVDCARRAGIDIGECEDDGGWDTWVRSGGPAPAPTSQWTKHGGRNCYGSHGATDLETPEGSSCGRMSVSRCESKCDELAACEGVTVSAGGGDVDCYRRGDIAMSSCDRDGDYDTWVRSGGPTPPSPAPPSPPTPPNPTPSPPTPPPPPSGGGVPTVQIAPGVHMPAMSLGTCCGSKPSAGFASWAKHNGGGTIGVDTSDDYGQWGGETQAALAAAIGSAGVPRDRLFILTKVSDTDAQNGVAVKDHDTALAQVKYDAQQLGVSQVDLVLLHRPAFGADAIASQWRGLEDALSQGLTRAIGVSNFDKGQLQTLLKTAKVKPAVNQCPLSVEQHDDATIEFCQQNGITYEAYNAAKGCDSGSSTLQKIAAAHGKSVYQVCLRYIVDRGCVMAVGTGADKDTADEYAKEDLDIFNFKLTAAEVAEINGNARTAANSTA